MVSPDTLTRLLKAAGLWVPMRRSRKHRSRRERRSCFGEMVQMAGSPHDSFEGRGPRCGLMNLVDDEPVPERLPAGAEQAVSVSAKPTHIVGCLAGWI